MSPGCQTQKTRGVHDINPIQVSTRVKKMNETRDQRFLKTVPRENRALAARELQP